MNRVFFFFLLLGLLGLLAFGCSEIIGEAPEYTEAVDRTGSFFETEGGTDSSDNAEDVTESDDSDEWFAEKESEVSGRILEMRKEYDTYQSAVDDGIRQAEEEAEAVRRKLYGEDESESESE